MKSEKITSRHSIADSVRQVLSEYVLPSSRLRGSEQLLLGQEQVAKLALPGEMRLLRRQQRKGRRTRSRSLVLASWPESKQIALQFPYLCFVYRGEADISVGDAIISCPAGHGIFIPPGTPLTDGSTPHWERADPEAADSDIFWMLLRPFGAECHLCHTRGAQHFGGGFGERALISNRHLFQLGEMLRDELAGQKYGHQEVSGAYWSALLGLLLRHCEAGESLPHQVGAHVDNEVQPSADSVEITLQRARRYIEDHLGQSLSLEEIAQVSFVSRAQLARLFQEKAGSTVWQYVTERRLEEAKSLLQETDISIFNIARLIGFPHASYFCTRFAQLNGCSPNEFRRRARQAARLPG